MEKLYVEAVNALREIRIYEKENEMLILIKEPEVMRELRSLYDTFYAICKQAKEIAIMAMAA